MSERKIIFQVELLKDNSLKVVFGTKHPAVLALALQHVDLQFKEMLLENIVPEQSIIAMPENQVQIPEDILGKL